MWNPNIYQKPGVYWEEITNIGVVPSRPPYPLTIVGLCGGKTAITEEIAISSRGTELSFREVDEVSVILTDITGNIVYERDVDYLLISASEEANTSIRLWSNGPTGLNASISPSGGNLSAGIYTYIVTAVSENGLETTSVSSENMVDEVAVPNGGIVSLTWNDVPGAQKYRIYRSSVGDIPTLLAQIDATENSYDDNGSLSPNGITTVPSFHRCYVRYNYTQEDRYEVKTWFDVDDLESFYGSAIDKETGSIINPLSFGARLASANGCQFIQTVGVKEDSIIEWRNALEKLKTLDNLDVVVLLTFNPILFADLVSFLNEFSDTSIFPMFILGGRKGISEDDILNAIPAGGNERIIALGNPYGYYFNPVRNTLMEIDGYYIACAVAGKLLSQPIQTPLTKRIISGIYSVPKITERRANYYTSRGLLMLSNKNNNVEVRHGVTTKFGNSATREISVVRSKYYMLRSLIEDLNNTIVGTALDDYTVISVKSIVAGRLDILKGSKIISEYMDVKARLNPTEPTRVDVKFKYRPSWPINYIVIQFSIDMTTGTVTSNL